MKKYGYVLEMRKTSHHYPGYYQGRLGHNFSGALRTAKVYSRDVARYLRNSYETVRKVELFKNGKPKKIVT